MSKTLDKSARRPYNLPMKDELFPRATRNTRISVRLAKASESAAENVTLSPEEEREVRWYADLLGYTSVSTFIREVCEAAGGVPEMAAACHLSVPEYMRTIVLGAIDNTSLFAVLGAARRFVRTKVGLPK